MRRRKIWSIKAREKDPDSVADSASLYLGNEKGSSNPRGKKEETFRNEGPMTEGRDKKILKLHK